MARLRRRGVVFSAKLQALRMALMGLIAGILYAFGGMMDVDASSSSGGRE